jgi:hypothetical protein
MVETQLLSVIRRQARHPFSWIVTGDESWFLYWYPAGHMFPSSRDEVIPRTKGTIRVHKAMMTILFSGLHLVTLKALPPGTRFNQEYFIDENLSAIINQRRRISAESSKELFPCTSTISRLITVKSRPMNLSLKCLNAFPTRLVRETRVRAAFGSSEC